MFHSPQQLVVHPLLIELKYLVSSWEICWQQHYVQTLFSRLAKHLTLYMKKSGLKLWSSDKVSLWLIKESHFKCWVQFRTLHEQHIMVMVILFLRPIFQLLLQQHWSPAVFLLKAFPPHPCYCWQWPAVWRALGRRSRSSFLHICKPPKHNLLSTNSISMVSFWAFKMQLEPPLWLSSNSPAGSNCTVL